MIKGIFKGLIIFIIVIAVIFIAYLGFMIVTDYKPEAVIPIEVENNQKNKAKLNEELSITTYNMGYCAMDKDMHFFMDGGKLSRGISKEKVVENLQKSVEALEKLNSNFMFLQEVDVNSTRSYKVNECEYIKDDFRHYGSTFAINYKCPWVPVPITKPHGKVLSGLLSLSDLNIVDSKRYDLPGKENFLVQLAELDRCMLVDRVSVENGKELVLVNIHLSAYDKGGKIRKQQLEFLKSFLEEEEKKGNYVIVGGDFNHQIPGSDPTVFKATEQWPSWLQEMPETFKPEGYQWKFDPKTATVRTAGTPYKKDENFRAIIDGFIVSDNIEVVNCKGLELDFKYSDHNPLTMTFKLK